MVASDNRALGQVSLAYVWWGGSAIFWNELGSVAPVDQLAWRVTTAFFYLAVGGFLLRDRFEAAAVPASLFRRGGFSAHLTRSHLTYGVGAALMIVMNWGLFLWSIDNGQAVEAALGYFLMPIISVALGVGLLGERLSKLQIAALILSIVGIVWTIVVVGRLPIVAILVGLTFALYGLLRKQGPWDSLSGLTFETGFLLPVLLAVLVIRGFSGESIAGDGTAWTIVLIFLTGVVTMVPLIAFASASKRVSLSVIGLLQYINPTLQFIVGWRVLGETVEASRLVGFAWIWLALALIVVDELVSKRPVDGVRSALDEGVVDLGERLAPEKAAVRRKW